MSYHSGDTTGAYTISANHAMSVLERAHLAPRFCQSGGGCGTIYVTTANAKHNIMVGPFDYYDGSIEESDISIGLADAETGDADETTFGVMVTGDEKLARDVAALVSAPDAAALMRHLEGEEMARHPRCHSCGCDVTDLPTDPFYLSAHVCCQKEG